MRMVLAALLALLAAAAPVLADARDQEAAPFCAPGQQPAFVFGFAALALELGETMGEPTTCEYPDPNGTGDVHQQTTTGLAFWRKATNIPTFTNGFEHWALSPRGLLYWTGTRIDPPGFAPFGAAQQPPPELPFPASGDRECLADTAKALDLLREKAPNHYAVVAEQIRKLECVDHGSAAYVEEGRVLIARVQVLYGTVAYAGTLVHEACHIERYRDGQEPGGESGETFCTLAEIDALERLGARPEYLAARREGLASRWWEVPYEDRWW